MSKSYVSTVATLAMAVVCMGVRAETVGGVSDPLGVVKIAKGQSINLGYYGSQSGPDSTQGIDEQRGAELAIKDAGGAVDGFAVRLTGEDAQCTAEGGQTAATKLAGNKQMVAVVGPSCSSGARVGAPILWNAGIASVATGATAPGLTAADRSPNFAGFLRAVPNDRESGIFSAKYAREFLKAKTAYLVHDGSPYTQQLAEAFAEAFTADGGQVLGREAISPTDTDFRPVLTRIGTQKPDVIFMPVFTSAAAFILRQRGEVAALKGTQLIGGEGVMSPSLLETAGDSVLGFRIVGASTDAFSDHYPAFIRQYTADYGEAPTGGFSAYGYDAAVLALKAIGQVAKQGGDGNLYIGRQALRDALYASHDVAGLTGKLSCSATGDCGASTYAMWEFTKADPASFAMGQNPKRIYP